MAHLTVAQQTTLDKLRATFGAVVSKQQLIEFFSDKNQNGRWPMWFAIDKYRVGRGLYTTNAEGATPEAIAQAAALVGTDAAKKPAALKPIGAFKTSKLPAFRPNKSAVSQGISHTAPENVVTLPSQPEVAGKVKPTIQIGGIGEKSLVPEKDVQFVSFGNYDDVHRVIKTGLFYPVFITGLSGNGKTFLVQQACAALKREMIRVQITPETDEDDLIGGFRLINGETVWFDGPVTVAAQRGAICLIDEIDYGTGKISCLQGILEGKGIFLKKVNRYVEIKPGFNIIATANTKGRGAEEHGGRYVNTNILNEALLERFALTLEQEFPDMKVEKRILMKVMESLNRTEAGDETFAEYLVQWADTIRRTFDAGGVEDVISTRRLVHVVRAYAIFGDGRKAVEKCVTRFDSETKQGFIAIFDKIAAPKVGVAAAVAGATTPDMTGAKVFTP